MCFVPQRVHFFDIATSKSGPKLVCFVIPLTISTGEHVLDTIPCFVENSCKKMESCTGFLVRGRALHLVAAFHLALANRKCILQCFISGCVGSYRKPYSPLLPVMLGHINIWLGPSDHFWLLTHDHFVVR